MMLVSLISYIDRNTLAILSPAIFEETGLIDEQYGYIISAFSVAYMIGNPVWGWLLDRFGLWIGCLLPSEFWTLASAAHAFGRRLWGFARPGHYWASGKARPSRAVCARRPRPLPESVRPRRESRSRTAAARSARSLRPLLVTPIAAPFRMARSFLVHGLVGFAWLGALGR